MNTKTFGAKIKAAGEADGLEAGQFEAIVSVFNNVDSVGDRVMPGAFADSLAEWKASGDPIPVVWSHRWDDPDYHIGYVIDAEEQDKGLWIKGQLDLDDEAPKAKQVNRLLKGRRVKQFSFSYDIDDGGSITEDGDSVYELRKLRVYEVGPTLLGANQETELIAAKHQKAVSDRPWSDFTPADYSIEQWRRACLIDTDEGDEDAKARYKLPVREPSGALNRGGCHAAAGALAGARGGIDAPDDKKRAAARTLVGLYRNELDEDPPEALLTLAGMSDDDGKALAPAAKAGRVLSAKNESALRSALDKIAEGVQDVKTVLSALDTDDGKATAPGAGKAEEPSGAKAEDLPGLSPASVRLLAELTELDLAG